MATTSIVAIVAGAAVVAVPPVRRRVLPVASAIGKAGLGIGSAVIHGLGDVAGVAWRGGAASA